MVYRASIAVACFALLVSASCKRPKPTTSSESAVAFTSAEAAKPEDEACARAIKVVKDTHRGKDDDVYATYSSAFQKSVSLEKHRATTAEMDGRLGKLIDAACTTVPAQTDAKSGGSVWSIHVAAFFERGAAVYSIAFGNDWAIVGLSRTLTPPSAWQSPLGEEAPSGSGPADNYVSKRTYTLPAQGKIIVGNANHAGYTQQWYGFDLDPAGADGKAYAGDGRKNEDYAGFKKPILSPADGTVVTVVDGVPDNVLGEENHDVIPGNHIVIDHGNDEYSLIAHVEPGSFVVKVGDHVKAGQTIANEGNSGNSTNPHIHWHVSNDPRLGKGHGLPIRLVPLLVNGRRVETPKLAQNDLVEVAP